jgi:methionine-S-sulfoxide reductase
VLKIFLSIFLLMTSVVPSFCAEKKEAVKKAVDLEMSAYYKKATLCGGSFWALEGSFERLRGVKSVISGYTGGTKRDPTYQEVAGGSTGHCQAIEITYDPLEVSFDELLEYFWQNIDPTSEDHQFTDVGRQYRPEIFYHDEGQKRLAQNSKEALAKSGQFDKPIVVVITPVSAFYSAEENHQDYYKKNAFQYKFDRFKSGRDRFLNKVWKDARVQ